MLALQARVLSFYWFSSTAHKGEGAVFPRLRRGCPNLEQKNRSDCKNLKKCLSPIATLDPVGTELFCYVNTFFCSNKFAWLLATWGKTLYIAFLLSDCVLLSSLTTAILKSLSWIAIRFFPILFVCRSRDRWVWRVRSESKDYR